MNGIANEERRKTLERTYREPVPIGVFINVILSCCLGAFGTTLLLRQFHLIQPEQTVQKCHQTQ